MKTILITGSSGFIGKNITKFLKIKKFRVIKISLKRKHKIIYREPIYALIHCAAVMYSSLSFSQNYIYKINQNINKKVIKIISKNKINKIIYTSSVLVYGGGEKIINENSKINLRNPYAKSKFKFEQKLKKISKKFSIKILCLRLPSVIGHGSRNNFIYRLVNSFVNKKKIIKLYQPNCMYNNCIHIDTLVFFIFEILKKYKKKFDIINLSSSHPVRLKKILYIIKKRTNSKSKIVEINSKNHSYLINSNKAVKKYNFKRIKTISSIKKYLKNI